jgi:hypothetical protein
MVIIVIIIIIVIIVIVIITHLKTAHVRQSSLHP